MGRGSSLSRGVEVRVPGAPHGPLSALLRILLGSALTNALLLGASVQPASAATLSLTITAQPTSASPTVPFVPQPTIAFSPSTASPGLTENTLSVQLADSAGNGIYNPSTAQLSVSAVGPCPNNKCTVRIAAGSTSKTFGGLSIDKVGTYRLIFTLESGWDDTAATPAISVPFTVSTGPPAQLRQKSTIAGSARGAATPAQLVVELEDAGGNPIVTDSVNSVSLQLLDAVTLLTPNNGAILNGATTATLSRGVATFTGLSINLSGDYALRASPGGVPGLSLAIRGPKYSSDPEALDAPIFVRDNQLVITSGPSSGKVGQPLDALVVQLTDSSGAVQNADTSVVLHLVQNGLDVPFTYAGATATSTTSVALTAGTATLSGIVISSSQGPGSYSFVVEAAGTLVTTTTRNTRAQAGNFGNTAPATGPQFVVSDRQLLFQTQPSQAEAGSTLKPSPTVDLADADGRLVGNSTDTVTVALPPSPSAKLAGLGCAADGQSCTLPLSGSRAVFTGLSVDTPGTYTLTATTSALDGARNPVPAATSSGFTLRASPDAPAAPPQSAPPPDAAPAEATPADAAPADATPAGEATALEGPASGAAPAPDDASF